MSERYSKLFSLPGNLYAEGAPVILAAGNLLKDNETGKILAQLKLKSISPKTIKAVKVRLFPLDTAGKPLGEDILYEYLDLNIMRDGEFGQKSAVFMPSTSTRAFSVEPTEVIFTDNSIWTAAGNAWESLPAQEGIGDWELLKQYQLHFGAKAQYQPIRYKDAWLCACGAVNTEDEATCHACGTRCAELLACDMDALTAEKEQRLAEENAAREAKEAAAEEAARKTKKTLLIVIPVVLACLAAILLITQVIIPGNKYKEAAALMEAGEYDQAITAYEALAGYKDSAEQAKAARTAKAEADRLAAEVRIEEQRAAAYSAAEALAQAGKTYEAAVAFYRLKDYQDALSRCFALWNSLPHEIISCYYYHTVGLRTDGTVVAVGDNTFGERDVSNWTDIVAVSAGFYHTVGLRANGTVVAVGDNQYHQCDVSGWTDIVAISAGSRHTVGLRANGTVVAVGRNIYGECDVSNWTDIVAVSAGEYHTVGLRANGTVVAVGDNTFGRCDVSNWTDIVAVSVGSKYTVGLHADGTVVAVGINEHGQCDVSDWTDIVAISAGGFHTVGLRTDGTVVAAGSNFGGSCNVSDWTDIVAVSASSDRTVGLRADGTVVAVGNNLYGELNVSDWTDIKLPK